MLDQTCFAPEEQDVYRVLVALRSGRRPYESLVICRS